MNSIEKTSRKRRCCNMGVTMKVVHRNFSNDTYSISDHSIVTDKILRNYWSWSSDELTTHIENLIAIREKIRTVYQNNTLKHFEVKKPQTRDEKFLSHILAYVKNNIDNPELTVCSIMSEMNLSRTHLHRKLKLLSGLSTTEFIRTIRLKKAAQLLKQKADNISQIAYQTGFSDCSYFTKCFKQQYGVSPSEFSKGIVF